MKLQKLVCAAVLSTLALGVAGPTASALEEARSIEGKGTIKYIEDDDSENEGNEVIDPENPEEKLDVDEEDGTNTNDKKGTLRVDFLSHLKFGDQNKITTGAGEYYASATNGKKVDGGKAVKRGNFIQVTDKRGDGAKGWTLSAEVTKPFTNGTGEVLKGANITYTLPFVNSTQDLTNYPTAVSTVELETTGSTKGSKKMASAEIGKGWGAYTIEYGRPSLDAQGEVVEDGSGTVEATMEKAVKLSVPVGSPLNITSAYEAEITWTIAEL